MHTDLLYIIHDWMVSDDTLYSSSTRHYTASSTSQSHKWCSHHQLVTIPEAPVTGAWFWSLRGLLTASLTPISWCRSRKLPHFWLVLMKGGDVHAQPFSSPIYSCDSEPWTWISSVSLQQRRPTTTIVAVEKSHEVKGRNISLLFSTCKTTSGVLGQSGALQYKENWHPWVKIEEGHLNGYGIFILQDTQNLTEQSPEEPVLFGLLWACGWSRQPHKVSPTKVIL